jgi:hypothetical protein
MNDIQITPQHKRMAIYIVLAAAAGLCAAWLAGYLLPQFLLYATPSFEADAVALMLGPDEEARRRQADELIAAGWAKYLIVPYEGEIYETKVSRTLVTPRKTATIARGIRTELQRAYVERTHIEALQTRELMEHIGATRVIFVSSPYHMRRIKIIAGRVFDSETYTMAYVPTVYDPPHSPWFASWSDIRWVVSEWGKIIWFWVYAPFL